MPSVVWQVPGDDRGLAYGDGVFETILVRCGQPFLKYLHLRRLCQGAAALGISCPESFIDAVIQNAVSQQPNRERWVLKLMLTRGSGGRGYRPSDPSHPRLLVSAHEVPPVPHVPVSVGLSAEPVLTGSSMDGYKHLSRLSQVQASRQFRPGLFEMIMPDANGRLVEGTRSNLLMAWDNQWITPPMRSLAVRGVMLDAVISMLRSEGQAVRERPLAPADIVSPRFGGMAIMNSVFGVVPVQKLETIELPQADSIARIASCCFEMDSDLSGNSLP